MVACSASEVVCAIVQFKIHGVKNAVLGAIDRYRASEGSCAFTEFIIIAGKPFLLLVAAKTGIRA